MINLDSTSGNSSNYELQSKIAASESSQARLDKQTIDSDKSMYTSKNNHSTDQRSITRQVRPLLV